MGRLTVAERFHAAYLLDSNGCWIWQRRKIPGGYGHLWMAGRNHSANRVSWILHHGPIPDGMFVCHRCDVPACVNPDHLFLGTPQDNVTDKVRKGRHRAGRGERNGHAKLTTEQVFAIRADQRKQRDIAADYGICQQQVSNIKRGYKWSSA